jgi:cation/acetate symporter
MENLTQTEIWTYVMVILSFGGYLYIGYANRVRDTKGFYVAGQGVPAIANGAATAADWMSAASFISMAGLVSFMGYDGSVYLMGWTGGYVLLAMLLAPYLRKFGKYTVPDFVGDRYYSQAARSVAAVATVVVSFTYVAGQMRGVGVVFSRFLGLPVWGGVVVGMVIVSFFAVLGGMKGITWTQVAQYSVLIVAYLIPAVVLGQQLTGWPLPQLAFTFGDLGQTLETQLVQDLGLKSYFNPFQEGNKSMLEMMFMTIALMIGTAGLPHVIVRFYTVPNVRAARYSAGWALLFIALLYTTAPALAIIARSNLITNLNNKSETEILSMHWAESWHDTGLLTWEDKDGNGVMQFKADPEASEITIDRDIIVLSTPEVAKLPPLMIALVAAGGLAAALSTASGLLLAISSAVSHDLYYRLLDPNADEKRRLLVGRAIILVAVIIAGYFGINPPGFVAQVVAIAFGLAAASIFPIILLGIFDSRTNKAGAIAGMSVGLIFTLAYIIPSKFFADGFTAATGLSPNWFFGVSPEGIGTLGAIINITVTVVVSRLTPPPPAHIRELVESVRVPRGAGEATGH